VLNENSKMSSITPIGNADNSALRASRAAPAPAMKGHEPAPWSRSAVSGEKARAGAAAHDGLPQWMTNAAQQIAGASSAAFPRLHELGVHIGRNIRSYIDGDGNLRADIAQWLGHPAVLAAAASVAPRVIGALAMNQVAFGAPPQIGRQPPP
jgi:hypothetical protein